MLYILNTATLPLKEGEKYIIKASQISIEQAREMLEKEYYTSAIGHEATAKLLSNILGQEIPFNRIQITLQPKDRLLAFLLKKRLPEGTVIKTVEELEQIGYTFWMFYIYSSDDPNPCL
jgi:predicted nucleotidyltransferase